MLKIKNPLGKQLNIWFNNVFVNSFVVMYSFSSYTFSTLCTLSTLHSKTSDPVLPDSKHLPAISRLPFYHVCLLDS